MAVCAVAVQQPDGSFLLGLNPAQTNLELCAYTVQTGSDAVWSSLGSMSIENAQTITASIVLLWAIAWTFRMLAKSLNHSERFENE